MIKLSTGDDSTLGSYLKLTKLFFGPDSRAVTFLVKKIKETSENEEVIVEERQMVYLIEQIHLGKTDDF